MTPEQTSLYTDALAIVVCSILLHFFSRVCEQDLISTANACYVLLCHLIFPLKRIWPARHEMGDIRFLLEFFLRVPPTDYTVRASCRRSSRLNLLKRSRASAADKIADKRPTQACSVHRFNNRCCVFNKRANRCANIWCRHLLETFKDPPALTRVFYLPKTTRPVGSSNPKTRDTGKTAAMA